MPFEEDFNTGDPWWTIAYDLGYVDDYWFYDGEQNGIDDPYEAPVNAEIHLVSDKMSLNDEVNYIMQYLQNLNVLS